MLQYAIDLGSHAGLSSTYSQVLAGAAVLGLVLYAYLREPRLYEGIPAFGIDEKGWMKIEKARRRYTEQGTQLVAEAVQKFSQPYQMATDVGIKIFLPARFAEEIKNIKQMSFKKAIGTEFFLGYPGLDGMDSLTHQNDILQKVTRQNITQSLNLITDDLSDEATLALEEMLGDNKEWTSMTLKTFVLHLVARLSSRLFVGEELCRNEEWLELAKTYTLDTFAAARVLRSTPFALRRIAVWFLPEWKKVRQDLADAKRILSPVIEKRLERNRIADAKGVPRPKTGDTIQWFHDAFERNGLEPKLAGAQLALSVVAIHTTTELLTGTLLDLAHNDEFIDNLREEMIGVLEEQNAAAEVDTDGSTKTTWKKNSLYKLKLLDSALKESQRLHTRDIASMRRIAEAPVTLSDGTVIPKGAFTWVTLDAYKNPDIYADPEKYNPRRFLDLRNQPGQENRWQLVSTTADHLGFGHGEHACPGRFFASNEAKIALVHLLMKYDWKLPDGKRPGDVVKGGTERGVDGETKILFRRRQEEVSL
ncbi:Dihydromonacolin L monooxygenase LovA [Diaporthe amygdali]|uniref:Dihydromonacolin L monooxygenase LovA n=1 Tax=Phomopsis amygdali TaxID=1214568 RepID=UPI0022FF100A|nr:Dihydromonacolin L monooxygenase LovA [Diaporthe amygdali]KAJ0123570.1 Dihydromonacolin L monooxygenase LovA [Diaporthe amygdali]